MTSCVQMYFKLLGWAFAETGEKAPEFSQLFQALGVSICAPSLHVGLVTVGNTASRRRELIEFIAKVISQSSWLSWYRAVLCGGSIPRRSASKTQDRRPAERQRARKNKRVHCEGDEKKQLCQT